MIKHLKGRREWWLAFDAVIATDKKELPPDFTPDYGAKCLSHHDLSGFVCTRWAGHTGRHAAGDGWSVVAVWPEPDPDGCGPKPDGGWTCRPWHCDLSQYCPLPDVQP